MQRLPRAERLRRRMPPRTAERQLCMRRSRSLTASSSIYKQISLFFWLMPNQIHCSHILVKTEQEATNILERLSKGEKFANIAREVSLCPSGKRGGDLGTFGRGKMVKEFENAAFALQKGQISPIVKTKYGCHIIKRLE